MTQPDTVEALTRALRADLERVWAQVVAEQEQLAEQWAGLTVTERQRRLRAFEATMRNLADAADELAARAVVGAVQGAYELGAWSTATALAVSAGFDTPDLDAVTALARDTMSDLLRATDGMRQSVKALVRMLARDHLTSKLYTGLTAEQAGVRLAADIARHGVTSIVYTDGRRVGLSTYADMVLRTRTAEAYQEGGFNQGDALGIEWWEVFDGTGCGWNEHDDPEPANGKIVTLDEARAHPISHPNCRRSTSPRPDILTAAQAGRARPTSTAAQRDDQAAAEAARAAAQARTPRRVGLDRQVSRRLDLLAGTIPSPAAQRFAARTA